MRALTALRILSDSVIQAIPIRDVSKQYLYGFGEGFIMWDSAWNNNMPESGNTSDENNPEPIKGYVDSEAFKCVESISVVGEYVPIDTGTETGR